MSPSIPDIVLFTSPSFDDLPAARSLRANSLQTRSGPIPHPGARCSAHRFAPMRGSTTALSGPPPAGLPILAMQPRLLVVDDDVSARDGLRRAAADLFDVADVGSAELGCEALARQGPFAVIVADYRLPGTSGVEFLSQARQQAPDAVRVIMTGAGDMQAAVEAVNLGQVFRFLVKPTPASQVRGVLADALEQHRLLTAERELLEQTLAGAVRVLTEVLSVVSPDAFGRAARLKACVQHLVAQLGLSDPWQYEVAAMLSQIGCITLPGDTITKVLGGQPLTPAERGLVDGIPRVAGALLAHIPRLDVVARMISTPAGELGPQPADEAALRDLPVAVRGGWLLRVALMLDDRLLRGMAPTDAIAELRRPPQPLPGFLLDAAARFAFQADASRVELVRVRDLHTMMVADEDVRTVSGLLLVPRGQPVTVAVIQRLRGFARGPGVREPFRVRVPEPAALSSKPEPVESVLRPRL